MSDKQFGTQVWEDAPGQEWLGSVTMDTADQEMRDAGYELLEHVTIHLEDEDDERSIHIRLYERRRPTVRQLARAVCEAEANLFALSQEIGGDPCYLRASRYAEKLEALSSAVGVLRDAVGREEKSE